MSSDGEGALDIIRCVRNRPRRVSFQLDANGDVCVQVLGESAEENREEQLIIHNKVKLTYSRGQIDPIRVMQAKDQIEKLTKRTKDEIREWPPSNSNPRLIHPRPPNCGSSSTTAATTTTNGNNDSSSPSSPSSSSSSSSPSSSSSREDEIRRAGLVQYDGSFQPWFFGKITRRESEALLEGAAAGTFLVRLSENTVCCYTLSYRTPRGSRHFLIMMTTEPRPEYKLLGSYQSFGTLTSLIHHHSHSPVTKSGSEILLAPCPHPPGFTVIF